MREVACKTKRYDKQFKKEAVRLAQEIETRRVAEQLEMSQQTLTGWRQRKQQQDGGANIGSTDTAPALFPN